MPQIDSMRARVEAAGEFRGLGGFPDRRACSTLPGTSRCGCHDRRLAANQPHHAIFPEPVVAGLAYGCSVRSRPSHLRMADAAAGSVSAQAAAPAHARPVCSRSAWASQCGSCAGAQLSRACRWIARSCSARIRVACSSLRAAFLAVCSARRWMTTWAVAPASEANWATRCEPRRLDAAAEELRKRLP